MFNFGTEHGDIIGAAVNDVCSEPLVFPNGLKIFDQTFTNLYVSDNANVQFGNCNGTYAVGVSHPYSISAIDADLDFSQGGNWYYRKVVDADELSTLSGIIANNIDQQGLFVALTGAIVTYMHAVRHDAINDAILSVQIQIAYDGTATYANFQYGDVEFTKSVQELNENPGSDICLNTESGTATINPCDSSNCNNVLVRRVDLNEGYSSGNGGVRGRVIYKVDEPNPILAPTPPSPPPPVWWNPGTTGTIRVNVANINDFVGHYLPNYPYLSNHGCKCQAVFSGYRTLDLNNYRDGGLDKKCGNFLAARECVFLEGGDCYERAPENLSYSINNGTCLEGVNTCEGAVCRIDISFYRQMMATIEDINFSNETAALEVPTNQCRRGTCRNLAAPAEGTCNQYINPAPLQCCGNAPKVSDYKADKGTCSYSGRAVIRPNIYACSRNIADITII